MRFASVTWRWGDGLVDEVDVGVIDVTLADRASSPALGCGGRAVFEYFLEREDEIFPGVDNTYVLKIGRASCRERVLQVV